MRRSALLLPLLLVGCKDRLPHATKAELNTFLDGGVVMMEHVDWKLPNNQPVWPVETLPDLVTWLDPSFKSFGLKTHEQVKQVLGGDPKQIPTSDWDLIWFMHDLPLREAHWLEVLAADPNDLRAAWELAMLRNATARPEEALQAIANLSGSNPNWHDFHGARPGNLEEVRCSMLVQVGKLDAAREACELALRLGIEDAHRELAMIAVDAHQPERALAESEALMQLEGADQWAAAILARGLALDAAGRGVEARALWAKEELTGTPEVALFKKALLTPHLGAAAWERELMAETYVVEAGVLSDCGHYYLDLDLPQRAEQCFALSEKLEHGPAVAQRLVHLGEHDPKAALAQALEEVKTDRNVFMLSAIAWLYERNGDPWSSRKWANEALALNPRDVKATGVMWVACGDDKVKDYPCVIEYRKRLGLPTHLPGVKLPNE